jgi:hypothetical protein
MSREDMKLVPHTDAQLGADDGRQGTLLLRCPF